MVKNSCTNMYPSINHNVRLRKERHCVLMIDLISGYFREISPNQAVIISMLNGTSTINELGRMISVIYSITEDTAVESVINTINLLDQTSWIKFQSARKTCELMYNPAEFIFNPEENKSGSKEYKSPITIEFMLTKSCNFKCIYCYMDATTNNKLHKTMDFELFKKIAHQAKEMQVKRAFLAGGEPLLSRDIGKMVKLLLAYDIFPYISTNGSLLTETIINDFYSSGLEFIQLSFDTSNPLTFDVLTGKKNSFQKVDSNLKLMKDKGMDVRIKSVVTKKNWNEIEQLIDYCSDLQIFDLEIVPSLPSVGGRETLSTVALNKKELIALKEIVERKSSGISSSSLKIRYRDPLFMWPSSKPSSSCGGGISSLVVLQDGKTSICDMIPDKEFTLGNLNESTLSEIWTSNKTNSIRKLPTHLFSEECKACEYCSECRTGCFNLSKMTYGDYFAPDPRCPVRMENSLS